jgi:hypothetical protein
MSEAATAFWIPAPTMVAARPGQPMFQRGRDRQFESVENAVKFVMEELSDRDRPTAMIQTDNASIQYGDIERMHRGMRATAAH